MYVYSVSRYLDPQGNLKTVTPRGPTFTITTHQVTRVYAPLEFDEARASGTRVTSKDVVQGDAAIACDKKSSTCRRGHPPSLRLESKKQDGRQDFIQLTVQVVRRAKEKLPKERYLDNK